MSIAVPIPELRQAMTGFTWCYVVTVADSGRAHLVAVTPRLEAGVITADVGRSTIANATARPDVVLVFPPLDHAAMSLIVDATFEPSGSSGSSGSSEPPGSFALRPTKATLHRPAPPA